MDRLIKLSFFVISFMLLACLTVARAETLVIPMQLVTNNNDGKSIGIIEATDTKYGLLIKPQLHGLSPGLHGFHLHKNPSCADNGKAAGGHFDPKDTGKHLGPYSDKGHLGDLPALYVNKEGNANLPVLAPRLTTKDLMGHALMIHAGGDNYSDSPKKLGGGGERLACAVVYKPGLKNVH